MIIHDITVEIIIIIIYKIANITYRMYDIANTLLIDCLLIALDAHMFRHNGHGPGTKDTRARGRTSLGLGPRPISIMAEHLCIKGNQYRQYIIGKMWAILYFIHLLYMSNGSYLYFYR